VVKISDVKNFRIFWSTLYENYVITVIDNKERLRYNAIWFVKEKFNLSEVNACEKIKKDLRLNNGLESKINELINI